jgi:hypothetical protein
MGSVNLHTAVQREGEQLRGGAKLVQKTSVIALGLAMMIDREGAS